MENLSYSYPDSGNSSPLSRDREFDNPPPWEEQQHQQMSQNYKAKFMCSYGGKIQPRQHDNQLSYVSGETKILAVDRYIKFSTMVSKLSALCDADVTFKYQLPGEDLDALISVTNDDDLENMMHEYDRLYRDSAKPVRMRLFLFIVNHPNPSQRSFESDRDRDRFVQALDSGPAAVGSDTVKDAPPSAAAVAAADKVDFLFGLDKGVTLQTQPPLAAAKYHEQVPDPVPQGKLFSEVQALSGSGSYDRVMGSDQVEIQRQLQELQRLQISEGMYQRKSDAFLTGGGAGGYVGGGGNFYTADKVPLAMNFPPPPSSVQPHSNTFCTEKQLTSGSFPHEGGPEQPMYVIPGTFHQATQVVRPVTGPTPANWLYSYREQPLYSTLAPPQPPLQSPLPTAAPNTPPPPKPMKTPSYSEGFGTVRPSGYAQMAYDSTVDRQVHYTAKGGAVHAPPCQASSPVDLVRLSGVSISQEMKMVNKNSQGSV